MDLHTAKPEQIEHIRCESRAFVLPVALDAALRALCEAHGPEALKRYEREVLDSIERAELDMAHSDAIREFAIEQVLQSLCRVRKSSDGKQNCEDLASRRTAGRSELPETLEEQLQAGLEDSFPASDPPAVVSTSVAGGSKKALVGTDEHLRIRQLQQQNGALEAVG